MTPHQNSANIAQRSGNPPSIARLILSGPSFTFQGQNSFFEESHISSEDEDDSPLAAVLRVFHNHLPLQVVRPLPVAAHTRTRSYATNSSDRNAGNRPENPLEIGDSDDDDAVEVVQVVNGS